MIRRCSGLACHIGQVTGRGCDGNEPCPLETLEARGIVIYLKKDDFRAEVRSELVNTPETADFMAAVPLEAAHQRERWSVDHDAGKSPFDWFWLLGFLGQKAAEAAVKGDAEKAKHHTISTAAALANWHASLTGADKGMRPGIEPPVDHV